MKDLIHTFWFDQYSDYSDSSKIFYTKPDVSLIKSKAIEHDYSISGLAVASMPDTITFSSPIIKRSDRLKFITIPSTETNSGVFKIKKVVSSTEVRVTPPILVADSGTKWYLRSFEDTYPLSNTLTVSTGLWRPGQLKALVGFHPVAVVPPETSVDYRLNDGTDDYYWDGASWSIATATSDWSPEQDVDSNIGSFDISGLALKIRARLTTTDTAATPVLSGIIIRWKAEMSNHFDFYDSIIKYLKEIDAVDFVQDTITATPSITLVDWLDQNQNVLGVTSAYNLDVDPTTNILSNYSGGTVTFTSPQTGSVRIFFTYKPNIRFWPHQDMINIEDDLIPTIVVDNMDEVLRIKLGGEVQAGDYDYQAPEQANVEVRFSLMTQRTRTLAYLADALEGKLLTDSKISLVGTGREVSIKNVSGFEEHTRNSFSDLREGIVKAMIYFHPRFYEDPKLSYKIQSVINTII